MRLALPILLVMPFLTSPARSDEQAPGNDKVRKIAEIQKEIAQLRDRLASLEAQLLKLQTGDPIELLTLADVKRDTVAGTWQLKDKHLFGPGTPDAKFAFSIRPAGDYEFKVRFKRHEGMGGPILCLPIADRHVNFALDAYNGEFTALEAVDGHFVNVAGNPTQTKGKHVVTGKSHLLQATVEIKDANANIRIDLDGKRLVDWTGKPDRLSLHPAWRLNDDRHIGLRSWQPFEYESVQLRMLNGQAVSTRVPPAEK